MHKCIIAVMYKPEKKFNRKSIRLKEYDYRSARARICGHPQFTTTTASITFNPNHIGPFVKITN